MACTCVWTIHPNTSLATPCIAHVCRQVKEMSTAPAEAQTETILSVYVRRACKRTHCLACRTVFVIEIASNKKALKMCAQARCFNCIFHQPQQCMPNMASTAAMLRSAASSPRRALRWALPVETGVPMLDVVTAKSFTPVT